MPVQRLSDIFAPTVAPHYGAETGDKTTQAMRGQVAHTGERRIGPVDADAMANATLAERLADWPGN